MRTKRIIAILVLLVCIGVIFGAATTHDPWDGTLWDVTSPNDEALVGNTYKEIYDLRKGVATRINKEHETLATASAGGVHKQGSARAFFQDAAPGTQVDGSAFDAGDLGSLWFDSNASPDNQFNVLTATTPTWTPVSTEIIAVLLAANRTFAGTLTVTGESTFNNHVNLGAGDDLIGSSTSDIAFNTNKFTVAGATGNTAVGGTLGVTGATTATGLITANGGVTLGAGDDLIGSATSDITINTNKFTVAGATGNTLVAGTLSVTGAPTFTTGIFGARTLNDTSPATLVKATVYQSQVDGFLTVTSTTAGNEFTIFIEAGDSSPDVAISYVESDSNISDGCTVPIKKSDYVQVAQTNGSANPVMSFVPIGTGGLVAQ